MAKQFISLFLVPFLLVRINASSSDIFGPATAVTSRYWDCCKPSCGWQTKASFKSTPVETCQVGGAPLLDAAQGTGCDGGTSFACANNSPWAVNDTFSYGFVGAFLKGGSESTWCCACYQLTFTSGPVKGKTMIVQASNTDYDSVNNNTFTFGIPGGNTSYAGACSIQYNVPNSTFGTQLEGVATRDDCANLPAALQPGCYWRFDWFEDALAPDVEYSRVACPAALTNITTCTRTDETTFQATALKEEKSSSSVAAPFASELSLGFVTLFALGVSQFFV